MISRWVFLAIHSNRAARWRATNHGVRRETATLRVRYSSPSKRFLSSTGSCSSSYRGTDPMLFWMSAHCATNQQLTGGAFCLIRPKFRPDRFLTMPVFSSQILFQDLPGSGLGQALIKVDGTRAFVMRQARTAEFNQLALVWLRPRLQNHQRLRYFAPLFIRNGDHAGLQYSRMGHDDFFHFERRNVFTTTYDDVFFAVHDQQAAVLVDGGHVAGVEPLSAQRFGCRFTVIPVAFHDPVAPRDNFSDGFAIARDIRI